MRIEVLVVASSSSISGVSLGQRQLEEALSTPRVPDWQPRLEFVRTLSRLALQQEES